MPTLDELAGRIAPFDETWSNGIRMQVTLTNFARGLEEAGLNIVGAEHRLKDWLGRLPPTAAAFHVDGLYGHLHDALEAHIGDVHFLDTGRPVADALDSRALSIATAAALPPWLGADPSDCDDAESVKDYCDLLNRRKYRRGANAGKNKDAIWVTPMTGEAPLLVDRARRLTAADTRADHSDYAEIANRMRVLMGLSQYETGTLLMALVSRKTIGQLTADCADSPFMGPSVLEGRCHARWRHWPGDYGRTYRLGSGTDADGVAEAVRSPLPLASFEEFVYLGPITKGYGETDRAFATAIGANSKIDELLRRLHTLTGL